MTPYDRLSAILDDPGNRHGPNRACVPVSVAGGRTRYVWIDRGAETGRIRVTLFGNPIAELSPPDVLGSVRVSTAGHFTPSTRDALSWVVSGGGQSASLALPGSKGGDWISWEETPHTLTLYVRGETAGGSAHVLSTADGHHGHGWLTIPAEAFA